MLQLSDHEVCGISALWPDWTHIPCIGRQSLNHWTSLLMMLRVKNPSWNFLSCQGEDEERAKAEQTKFTLLYP